MEIQEILEQFKRTDMVFPREAIQEAAERQEEITPHLLEILRDTIDRAEELVEKSGYMAHLYAMFLLAQFREKQAYPLIVELSTLPGDLPEELMGDVITEDLHRLLASVCHGDTSRIKFLVENPEVNEWVRTAGLDVFGVLVAQDEMDRGEACDYLRSLYQGKLERTSPVVWTTLVYVTASLHCTELQSEVDRAFEEGLVETFFVDHGTVTEMLAEEEGQALQKRVFASRHNRPIEDTVQEMENWISFRESRPSPAPQPRPVPQPQPQPQPQPDPTPAPVPSQPFVHSGEKIGRNDPCPCGSGRKYKHCHGKPG